MKRYLFLGFLVVILCGNTFGQSQNLRFKHISLEEGLSQSYVLSICQDSKGFMWIGTSEGLNRYDGYEFRIFKNTNDPYSISDNQVNHIMEDSQGLLWISTWNGINVFDPETERFTRYQHDPDDPKSISSNYIQVCYEDKAGNIWVGVNGAEIGKGGLNLFNRENGTFLHYPTSKADSIGTSGEGVQTICEDSRNNLWIGTTSSGLKLFDRETGKLIPFELGSDIRRAISRNSVRAIFEDSKNNLWVGSREIGLCVVDRDAKVVNSFKNGKDGSTLPGTSVLSLGEDNSGNLWIGLDNSGLSIYNLDLQSFNNYSHDPSNISSLNNNSVYAICRDSKGNMWLGTFAGGLNFFNIDGNRFSHFRQSVSERGMNSSTVFCIRERSDGTILLGTDGGGLNIYDPNTGVFSHKTHEPGNPRSICGNNVLSVVEDNDGNIWVGTWGEGVTKYNPSDDSYRHYKNSPDDPNSIGGNNAWIIYEDSKHNIWIGTYWGGLNLYDKTRDNFVQYKMDVESPNTINSNVINSLIEDNDGTIWIGTVNGGLDKFDPNTQTFYNYLHSPDSGSLSNNIITSLSKDTLGNLWIGTANGLNYFDLKTEKFTVYTVEDGLVHNYIRGVLDDSNGNLWVSTNGGISRFHVASKKVKNFSVADGLQAPEFKTHAALRSRSGLMYFGGINGFNEFHPENVEAAPYDPPIVFTDFRVFSEHVPIISGHQGEGFALNKSVTELSEIVLSYKESVFSFEFASLNYADLRKKQYMYKLEGFDEKWNEIGTKRTATYTNLNPGEYTLKVKGLNNDGEWSTNILEMNLIITPPFWETWWFRILIAAGVIGLFAAWYTNRISRIKQQKDELEAQVKERTRELSLVNAELQDQRGKLEILFNDVKDSIRAAEVIQTSLLPSKQFMKKVLPESFVFYKPKDVVSGDFYWVNEKGSKIVIAVGDCTGHGVSGAFMSINGYHLLNNAINGSRRPVASVVLDRLHENVIRDENSNGQHGMEIALCILDPKERTIQYAGAGSPLYILRQGEILQFAADKFPIGLAHHKRPKYYANHKIEIRKGDSVYMFSDGYADQIGEETGEKFMYPRFRELLLKIGDKAMEEQRVILEKYLTDWQGESEQLDDILVVGFKIE